MIDFREFRWQLFTAALVAALMLSSCGGGLNSGLSSPSHADPSPGGNDAPYAMCVNHYTLDDGTSHLIQSLGNRGKVGVRMPFYWKDVEPQRGVWQLWYNDPFVEKSTEDGIPILGLLGYSTGWSSSAPNDFDFTEVAPFLFTWRANTGALAWHSDSPQGAVEYLSNAVLEDHVTYPRVLYARPPRTAGGYIQGQTSFPVPAGNQVILQAKVGFLESSAANTSATFSISYLDSLTNQTHLLSRVTTWNNGTLGTLGADLTPFQGQTLTVLLNVSASDGSSIEPVWTEAKVWTDGNIATMRGVYGENSAPIIYYPPADFDEFAEYVKQVVARYPQVQYWEIWNEPNLACAWRTSPNPTRYLQLLKKSYAAVKAGNPNAQVVLGGLSSGIDIGWKDVILPQDFLAALYSGGGKGAFDILGIHPYRNAMPNAYLETDMQDLKSFMESSGDTQKKIWITEIGWYTGTAGGAVSEATQAEYVQQVRAILPSLPFMERVYWYQLQDACSRAQDPECNYGLYRTDGSPKPAALAW